MYKVYQEPKEIWKEDEELKKKCRCGIEIKILPFQPSKNNEFRGEDKRDKKKKRESEKRKSPKISSKEVYLTLGKPLLFI